MKALNDILYLITPGTATKDEDGFPVVGEPAKKEVFCGVQSAKRSEYYAAKKDGINVALVFTIAFDDYDKEDTLEYDGTTYKIVRMYRTSEYYIELTCSEVE